MLCPAATLSVTINVPVRVPFAVGSNVTEIVQLIVADRIAGQLLVWEKSPASVPPIPMSLMSSGVCPLLVSCTGKVVLLLTACEHLADLDSVGRRRATG